MALNRTSWLTGIVVLIHQAAFAALEPSVFPVGNGQYGGSVAVGPHNTLVAWVDFRRTLDMRYEIFGARINAAGESLDGDGIPLTGIAGSKPAVAAMGDQFLIVWSVGPSIYARRMTSAGELLDYQPITITEDPSHPYPELVYRDFSVAADGVNFWVAWSDDRKLPAGTPEYSRYSYQDIFAARINRAGRLLDPHGIAICTRRGIQDAPRLSPRGDFIVWTDSQPARRRIFGARLHRKGFVLDRNGFEIMGSTNQYITAANVSNNGRGWLVAWGEPNNICAAQVHKGRAVSRPFKVARTAELTVPHVQTAGADCLVVWQDQASTFGVRVHTGKQLGQVVTLANDPNGLSGYTCAAFAGNGSRFCITGITAPVHSSWMNNDVWFGFFTPSLIP